LIAAPPREDLGDESYGEYFIEDVVHPLAQSS